MHVTLKIFPEISKDNDNVEIVKYNYSSCFEYALVDEVNKTIIYIYMQGTDYKIPKEYLPKDKIFNDKISIYHFNGKKVDKSF